MSKRGSGDGKSKMITFVPRKDEKEITSFFSSSLLVLFFSRSLVLLLYLSRSCTCLVFLYSCSCFSFSFQFRFVLTDLEVLYTKAPDVSQILSFFC